MPTIRFTKLGAAGLAAVAGAILVVSSVGAHQGKATAHAGLSPFTGIASLSMLGKDVDQDAAADAAALAAQVQKEAAEAAAAQQAAAAEQDTEAAEDAAEQAQAVDNDNDDEAAAQTGAIMSGDETAGHASTTQAAFGTKGNPKGAGD